MSRPFPSSSTEMVTPASWCETRSTMRPANVAAAEFLRRCARTRSSTPSSACTPPPPAPKSKKRSTPGRTSGCAASTTALQISRRSAPRRQTFKAAPCSKRIMSETSAVMPTTRSSTAVASLRAASASKCETSSFFRRSRSASTTCNGVRTRCSVRETNASKFFADRFSSCTMSSARASLTLRPVSSRMKQRVWLKSPLFV
mmetsp:Transcript_24203/g.81596  ORF Transcript_24203/g.81596 Transcript_24203/m.81596 type:complete len:201 (+) Transcript_24203:338-940(+)